MSERFFVLPAPFLFFDLSLAFSPFSLFPEDLFFCSIPLRDVSAESRRILVQPHTMSLLFFSFLGVLTYLCVSVLWFLCVSGKPCSKSWDLLSPFGFWYLLRYACLVMYSFSSSCFIFFICLDFDAHTQHLRLKSFIFDLSFLIQVLRIRIVGYSCGLLSFATQVFDNLSHLAQHDIRDVVRELRCLWDTFSYVF